MTDGLQTGGNGQRDARGRFLPGCAPGPGNPGAARVAEYRQAIAEAVKPKLVVAVLMKMAKRALGGDAAAARVFLDRTLGKIPDALPLEHESPELIALRFAAAMRELDDCVPKEPDPKDERYL